MIYDPYKIEPTQDRVIVRDFPQPSSLVVLIRKNPNCVDVVSGQTKGDHGDYRRVGIYGEVIAVGPGKRDKKDRLKRTTVKPGDKVQYTAWNDGEDFLPSGFRMITEGDIWGWIDGNA